MNAKIAAVFQLFFLSVCCFAQSAPYDPNAGCLEDCHIPEGEGDWDEKKAREWLKFIGPDGRGDLNRLYQSDPVLWRFLGIVAEKTLLDVGCGNGYLSRQLSRAGAHVISVDLSPEMIKMAIEISRREQYPEIDFHVDSGATLASIPDKSVDWVVSNYVLMDAPDLTANIRSMYRVLKYGGKAVVVILHPGFPLKYRTEKDGYSTFHWKSQYFDSHEQVIPPFDAAFSEPFLIHHRSFTRYWHEFREAGFIVNKIEEPKLTDQQKKSLNPELVKKFGTPISLVFSLHKPVPSTPSIRQERVRSVSTAPRPARSKVHTEEADGVPAANTDASASQTTAEKIESLRRAVLAYPADTFGGVNARLLLCDIAPEKEARPLLAELEKTWRGERSLIHWARTVILQVSLGHLERKQAERVLRKVMAEFPADSEIGLLARQLLQNIGAATDSEWLETMLATIREHKRKGLDTRALEEQADILRSLIGSSA